MDWDRLFGNSVNITSHNDVEHPDIERPGIFDIFGNARKRYTEAIDVTLENGGNDKIDGNVSFVTTQPVSIHELEEQPEPIQQLITELRENNELSDNEKLEIIHSQLQSLNEGDPTHISGQDYQDRINSGLFDCDDFAYALYNIARLSGVDENNMAVAHGSIKFALDEKPGGHAFLIMQTDEEFLAYDINADHSFGISFDCSSLTGLMPIAGDKYGVRYYPDSANAAAQTHSFDQENRATAEHEETCDAANPITRPTI